MKNKITGIFLLMSSCFACYCQKSYDYTMAIYNKISSFNSTMNEKYKDTFSVMRIETGVLSSGNNYLYSSAKRKLFYGNEYIIEALTDSRVKNFELKIYRQHGENWDLLETKVDDIGSERNSSDLIGNLKNFSITPDSSAIYKFEISTSVQNNISGRYGIMIWAKDISNQLDVTNNKANKDNTNNTSGTQMIYNVDNYSISKFDPARDSYGDFGEQTSYSCVFVINSGQKILTQRESSGSVYTYNMLKKDETNTTWIIYTIQPTSGSKYFFMIPKDGKEYIRMVKIDGNSNNPLTDFHISHQ